MLTDIQSEKNLLYLCRHGLCFSLLLVWCRYMLTSWSKEKSSFILLFPSCEEVVVRTFPVCLRMSVRQWTMCVQSNLFSSNWCLIYCVVHPVLSLECVPARQTRCKTECRQMVSWATCSRCCSWASASCSGLLHSAAELADSSCLSRW